MTKTELAKSPSLQIFYVCFSFSLANETLQQFPLNYNKIVAELHATVDRLQGLSANVTAMLQELLALSVMADNVTEIAMGLNRDGNAALTDIQVIFIFGLLLE